MVELERQRSQDLMEFSRELGGYLLRFEPGPRNHYREIAALARRRADIALSSLNYDLLLEFALSDAGVIVQYAGDRLHPNAVRLLKVHGSVNFLPDVPPRTFVNVRVAGGGGIMKSEFGLPVRPVFDKAELTRFYREEDSLAPAIAMYAPRKRFNVSDDFVDDQLGQWKRLVEDASRIVLIGVGVNPDDTHIWGPLARSSAWLGYVGRAADESRLEDWRRDAGRRQASFLADGFDEAMPFIRRMLGR